MKPASAQLPVLILAILLASAGCSAPSDSSGTAIPVTTDLATFALTPADLPFATDHQDHQLLAASPGHPIQDNRDILRIYTADLFTAPPAAADVVYLKQDIVQYEHGTIDTNYDATWARYQKMQDPSFTITMLDSPGVGDRSFAFSLAWDKGTESENPVTGIVFARSDIVEVIQLRAASANEATVSKIAAAADRKITSPAAQAASPPVTTETIPPAILETGDNSPVGVITRYYSSLDSGNYAAAAGALLPDLRPGADNAGAKQRFETLYADLYGQSGEKITMRNLAVNTWQQVDNCDIHRAGLQKICQDNHLDPVFGIRISRDETENLGSGPATNHYDESVYTARYNGTWYLIL